MVTGIGGQGIQLLAKTLAQAATAAGREVMFSAEYGGEMRGGPSLANVVIGGVGTDDPGTGTGTVTGTGTDTGARLTALPILEAADAAIIAHHHFSERTCERLRTGGLALLDSSVVERDRLPEILDLTRREAAGEIVEVPAADLAVSIGAPMSSGLILLGAFVALTQVVEPELLGEAMERLLPARRRQHIPKNLQALRLGADHIAAHAGHHAPSRAFGVPALATTGTGTTTGAPA